MLFDAVHIFKNIRNNWTTLRDTAKTFLVPKFNVTPNDDDQGLLLVQFANIRQLFRTQAAACLGSAFKLSYKACYTSGFDKQKVYLCEQLFHPSTLAALRSFGNEETADFCDIVRSWWEIFNIKSKHVGDRMRLENKKPFLRETIENDSRWGFLSQMVVWLDAWMGNPKSKGHRLTNDTFHALRQSCVVLPMLIRYLFENYPTAEYIITGKFQTDQLERHFGLYRMMAGNNYRSSMIQVLENEKKIRDRDVVKWKMVERDFPIETIEEQVEHIMDNEQLIPDNELELFAPVLEAEFGDNHPVVTDAINHVAGACANAVQRRVFRGSNCTGCIQLFIDGEKGDFDGSIYQAKLQRGGLFIPSTFARSITQYAMIMVMELYTNPTYSNNFISVPNQKLVIESLLHKVVDDFSDDIECEECGSPFTWHVKIFLSSLSNTVLVGLSNLVNKKMELRAEMSRIEKEDRLNKRKTDSQASIDDVDMDDLSQPLSQPSTSSSQTLKVPLRYNKRKTTIFTQH